MDLQLLQISGSQTSKYENKMIFRALVKSIHIFKIMKTSTKASEFTIGQILIKKKNLSIKLAIEPNFNLLFVVL